jgi:hypothetical protein
MIKTKDGEYKYTQALKQISDEVREYQFTHQFILGQCFNENEEPTFRQEEINKRLDAERRRLINDLNTQITLLEKIKF